uniref:Uncharacterized protein n=1 Tax=Cannabis sativa TaxID=3483 RepID=A0A803NHT3_CANSA
MKPTLLINNINTKLKSVDDYVILGNKRSLECGRQYGFLEDFMVVKCSSKEVGHHALVECEFATAAWNRSLVDVGGGSATFSS